MQKEKLTGLGSKPRVNELQCKPRVGTEGMQSIPFWQRMFHFKLKGRWGGGGHIYRCLKGGTLFQGKKRMTAMQLLLKKGPFSLNGILDISFSNVSITVHPLWHGAFWGKCAKYFESFVVSFLATDFVAGRGTPSKPETGLLSNTRKWIVRGDTCADKARDFSGKRHPGGEQESKGTQENCSATWLAVSGFMVMGLVSGLSLANHSDSESCLVAQPCSAKMDAREKDSGRWSDMWCLLWRFPNSSGWWWLISSVFLTRTSCPKTAHANGYYGAWPGWAVSVSVLPLTAVLFATGRKQKQPRCPSMK